MKKEFCTYKQSLELKELGFDEPCFGRYNNNDNNLLIAHTEKYIISNGVDRSEFFTLAPIYQQAFRWLYQKLDIEKGVMPLDTESQQLLLKELIDKVSSKHLLV